MQSISISNCRCRTCVLATAEKVPSDEPWKAYMRRSKPRVLGFRCHASRPSQAGFPIVYGEGYCAYFTDQQGRQPLRHLVSEVVKAKEVEK